MTYSPFSREVRGRVDATQDQLDALEAEAARLAAKRETRHDPVLRERLTDEIAALDERHHELTMNILIDLGAELNAMLGEEGEGK